MRENYKQTTSNVVESFISVRIKLSNDLILRYSTLDFDIKLHSEVYKPCIDIKSISSTIMSARDSGITIIVYDDLSKCDLSSSRVEISFNNRVLNDTQQIIYIGSIGSCLHMDNMSYELQILPLFYSLNKSIGEFFSPLCRASLGDKRCGKDLSTFTFTGIIMTILDGRTFIGNHQQQKSGYFLNGMIIFADGVRIQIENESDRVVTMILKSSREIVLGERYSIIAGCDKSISTCKNKFCNVINFRGEPFI